MGRLGGLLTNIQRLFFIVIGSIFYGVALSIFRGIEPKKMTGDDLFKNWYILGVKKLFQATPTKRNPGTE